jgi:hypothetical protein
MTDAYRHVTTTPAEFEQDYADRSDTTVPALHAAGRYVEPCDCTYEYCEGWSMGHQWEDAIVEDRCRRLLKDDNKHGRRRHGR